MKLKKQLWRISVATSLEAEDAVMELLNSFSTNSASAYFNLETQASLVSVFSEKPFPKSTRANVAAGLREIKKCDLDIGTGEIEIAKVKREDWAESWKKHFRPLEIGDSLLVKPSWSKKRPHKNQAVVILDPGLSFGTGQHPTTSFCLGQIAKYQGKDKSFFDLGTGSGILAIAAAKLGFAPVQAVDFDPDCVRIAQANARNNRVQFKIRIKQGDVTKLPLNPKVKYDLVCANLISNLLIAERRRIIGQLKAGGILVLAGILKIEFSQVQAAFEQLGLKLIAARSEKEWCSGSFRFVKK